jgi:arylsulfatase A-like enzyme
MIENAQSNAQINAPSRVSLLSGILPITSKNFRFDNWLNNCVLSNSKIISKYMIENGYTTYKTGKMSHNIPVKTRSKAFVYNALGKVIIEEGINDNIDVSCLETGIYFLKIDGTKSYQF